MEEVAGGFLEGWWGRCVRKHRCFADVQAVHDGSGRGTLAMLTKQLESVGCPTWLELAGSIEDSKKKPSSDELRHSDHILGIFSTTDCGSDQVWSGPEPPGELLQTPGPLDCKIGPQSLGRFPEGLWSRLGVLLNARQDVKLPSG
eukprot:6068874-Pyramimonas_sp.AAC.2